VTNRLGGDADEVYGRMRVWCVDHAEHLPVLPSLLVGPEEHVDSAAASGALSFSGAATRTTSSAPTTVSDGGSTTGSGAAAAAGAAPATLTAATLASTAFVITIPLNEPQAAEDSLNRWLTALSTALTAATAALPAADLAAARSATARRLALYNDPTPGVAASSAAATLSPEEAAAATAAAIASGLPAQNLGVPLVVVGTNASALCRSLLAAGAAPAAAAQQLELLAAKLRRACMPFGAALIFTSADAGVTPAANRVTDLQDYLTHLLYDTPLVAPARSFVTPHDWGLYLPTGADSASVLASLLAAKPSLAAAVDAPLSAAFASPVAVSLARYERTLAEQLTHAMSPEALRAAFSQAQERRSTAAGAGGAAAGGAEATPAAARAPATAATAATATPVGLTVPGAVPATPSGQGLSFGAGASATPVASLLDSSAAAAAAPAGAAAGKATPANAFFKSLLNKPAPSKTPAAAAAAAGVPTPAAPKPE
jgi:hypothetical protein